ncbi:MAG: hypothetical protein ACREJ3_09675, partial [Polyangiaceae bacterium]
MDPAILSLRVEIARKTGDDHDLAAALEAIAATGGVDGLGACEALIEAAQAAARIGDFALALDRACRAARADPESATSQLLARGLEYRLRGSGTPDEARDTIEQLARIREVRDDADVALRAFLLAEALDVVRGQNAGLRELEAARAAVGDHPLIALGMAERMVSQGRPEDAVDAYRVALSGSLLDLRRVGNVALLAADAAVRAHRPQDADHFLDRAEAEAETQAAAREMRSLLAARIVAVTRPTPPAGVNAVSGEAGSAIEVSARSSALDAGPHARLAYGRSCLERGHARGAEPPLWEALAGGVVEAGDVLAPLIAASPDRGRDMIRLRRQQVA